MNATARAEDIILPHNLQLEKSLLGAIFTNNDAFFRVSDFLEPAHFFEPIHRRVYEIAAKLLTDGKLVTPAIVKTFLPDEQKYLAHLAAEAVTVIQAADYGKAIKELSDRRGLILLSEELASRAAQPDELSSIEDIAEAAQERLHDLTQVSGAMGGFITFAEAARASIDLASKAYQRDGHLSGLATGLADLDHLMGGLQNSDLIILAGRPGIGKTALATNVAKNVAAAKSVVGFFSLEMSSEQLATRLISERSEVPSSRVRRGDISEAEFSKLATKADELHPLPLYIDSRGGISIAQLVSRARRLKRERGLELLIIDYIQLLRASNHHRGNRVQEVTEITSLLKGLAKELNVPILALSQLSRQVESRDDKRPQLSDLRESGSIEQDADVVLFVYREEYYLKNKEPKGGGDEWIKWDADLRACEGQAEIIIGKQRHGPTGMVRLSFEAHYTRFGNLARDDRAPPGKVIPFKERGVT